MSQIHICGDTERKTKKKKHKFPINDHNDILIEVLQRLDGRSLGAAACVCRQWCSIVRNDSLWEHLCFRQLSPQPSVGVRSAVLALGGYRRLYMVYVRPVVMSGLKKRRVNDGETEVVRRVWNRHEVELSLSLFCVEYYERLLDGGESPAESLKFLCKTVNMTLLTVSFHHDGIFIVPFLEYIEGSLDTIKDIDFPSITLTKLFDYIEHASTYTHLGLSGWGFNHFENWNKISIECIPFPNS